MPDAAIVISKINVVRKVILPSLTTGDNGQYNDPTVVTDYGSHR